jgi:hypothetical protein
MPPKHDTNWNGRFEDRGDAGLNACKRIWWQFSTVLGRRGRIAIWHCFLSNACVVSGSIDPQDGPEIVDQKSCVVVLRDPKFNRYIRYYLSRFNMDDAIFGKKYSGSRPYYELDVKGDDVVFEYLSLDKKTVIQGYRSAQIPLPGDIDQTQKALRIIFTDHCKAKKPKAPF